MFYSKIEKNWILEKELGWKQYIYINAHLKFLKRISTKM